MERTHEQMVERLLELMGDGEPTQDGLLEAAVRLMRESAYYDHPTANPMVVEALLLMYREMYESICKEIDEQDYWTEDDSNRIMNESVRFGRAMNKTLKQMTA